MNYIPVKLTWNGTKFLKHPLDPHGRISDAHDPSNWMTYEAAAAIGDAVGIVLTDDDDLWCLDVDHALKDGQWSDLVNTLYAALPGAYFEQSVSGDGCHFWGRGQLPDHACKNTALGIELYHTKRFIVMGKHISGSMDARPDMTQIVATFFPPITGDNMDWTNEPVPEYTGPEDDDELLRIAFNSRSVSGAFGGCTFNDLWNRNVEAIADRYPAEDREYDASSADAALASHLAFWTGKNCERMKRLMLRSGLVREKWRDHKTYLTMTILNAARICTSVVDKPKSNHVPEVADKITNRADNGFCTLEDQKIRFRGCVYVADEHAILTPNGMLLKPDKFNAKWGGMQYVIDDQGKVKDKAFEAFTNNRALEFPKADRLSFAPDQPFQAVSIEDDISFVNFYKPYHAPLNNESPAPFLTHVEKLLPDERDREILLSWMAAVVQYRGKKIFWAPLLQGAQGNGKTLFTDVLLNIVGDRYTHLANAGDLENKFNGWLRHKILIGIEDIYIPESKLSIMEALKPMITGQKIEIQAKGMDQRTEKVCANFILNTNHKDALVKTDEDRRYAIFYTAQQTSEDILHSGMGGDYFPNLYGWLRGDGYGAVHNYLRSYQIRDELNPMIGAHRAPKTSSTDEAIEASLGPIAQDILEAVSEGRRGFNDGWISFPEAKKIRKISPMKLNDIIESMGYSVPKAFGKDRRTNMATMTDGVKARLFLRNGHPLHNVTEAAELMHKYDDAQNGRIDQRLRS